MRQIINQTCGLNNVLQDKNLFYSMLQLFVKEHAEDDKKLTLASTTGDIVALFHTNHTLKGVSASLGFERLYDSCYQLDKQFKTDEPIENLTNKSLKHEPTSKQVMVIYEAQASAVIHELQAVIKLINQELNQCKEL